MLIFYDDNRHLTKFFQQHKQYETAIHQDITFRLPQLINSNSPKIKLAKPFKFKQQKVYEYKIVVGKAFTCRVAYIYEDDVITVIFISETIIKYQFCLLLAKTEIVFC